MRRLTLIITLFFTVLLFAQDFQGIATYKSHRKMDLKMDGVDENSEMHKKLKAQLAKQFQKEYTLTFTKEESIYKQNESLAPPAPSNSGISITVSDGNDVVYKNLKENRYTNATEIFGKQFLIKDSLKTRKWELLSDIKNIGDYTCRKAVFKDSYKTQTIGEDGNIQTIEKERETVAWYTLEIPASNGPSEFYGLPGLILEVNDGELSLMCSKIVLNPKDKIEINEPKRGKVVNQEKFEEILKKKTEETFENFRSRDKDGNSQIITIGG
ncbi:GLPGLI family protein [Lacinutrix chionoecetis]